MSKNIKVLATVVPNPYKSNPKKNEYHFSVFFSPRLPETGFLYDYYEIANWDKFLKTFVEQSSFYLQLSTGLKVKNNEVPIHTGILCNQITFNNGHEVFLNAKRQLGDLHDFELGGKIWKSIFKDDTPVEGWYYDVPMEIKNIARILDVQPPPPKQAEFVNENDKKIYDTIYPEIQSMMAAAMIVNPLNTSAAVNGVIHKLDEKGITDAGAKSVVTNSVKVKSYKDYLDIKNYKRIKSTKLPENQEFHKKFSILSHYPDLLRATGWILDFCFELDSTTNKDIRDSNVCRLQITYDETNTIDEEHPKLGDEIEFICPWTTYNNNEEYNTLFSIRYKTENETYFQVKKGFINTIRNVKLYNPIITAQSEDTKRQIMDIISTLLPSDTEIKSNKIDDKLNIQINKLINDNKENFNSKISTGIGIVIDNNPAGLTGNRTKTNQDALKDNPQTIWGEDLDVGYRIDVANYNKNNWHSLCKRKADYYIDIDSKENNKKTLLLKEYSDEPWVAESAQLGASGAGYIHEEICRWNNWSLTCPHTGKDPEFSQDENTDKNNEYNDLEISNLKPDSKLFPLRFNKAYKFRLRIVDICGNSASLSDIAPRDNYYTEFFGSYENIGERFYLISPEYKRLEDIHPPELFFAEDRFKEEEYYEEDIAGQLKPHTRKVLNDKYPGEDLYTMVIKSYDPEYKKDHNVEDVKESTRIIAPPRVTPHFAEVQGAFDEKISKKEFGEIYDLCKGKPKEFYDWTFWDRVKHSSTWNTNNDDEPIGNWSSKIDYVTDKDVNSIKIFCANAKPISINYLSKSIFNRSFKRIILKEFSEPSNALIFAVPQGQIKEYTLQCKDEVNNISGNVRKLTMLHAIQKPIDPNKELKNFLNASDKKKIILTREKESSKVKFNEPLFKDIKPLCFPSLQSGEFRLIASFKELVFDRTSPIGYSWKNVNEKEIVYSQIIKSFSNFQKDEDLANNKKGFLMNLQDVRNSFDATFIGNEINKGFELNFPDTKYREVDYEIKAFSKFRDFFADVSNEDDFAVSYKAPLTVKNSSKPKAPKINKIIPVFSWTEKDDTVTRIHNKFRIYFDDDEWYTTGAKEGIAVIVMENKSTNPHDNNIEPEYSKIFSQLGTDPIQNNDSIPALLKTQFKGDSMSFIKDRDLIHMDIQMPFAIGPGSLDANLLGVDSTNNSSIKNQPASQNVQKFNYVIYPVFFDNKSNPKDTQAVEKFYADIEFDNSETDRHYFPFIKFALCRYQENSLTGVDFDYRFSNVVMTPQAQIIPTRIIHKKELIKKVSEYKDRFKQGWKSIKLASPFFESKTVNSNNQYFIIKDRDNHDFYFEEYEVYEVDGKFKMDENPERGYTPRNDISKRLVYSYKV